MTGFLIGCGAGILTVAIAARTDLRLGPSFAILVIGMVAGGLTMVIP